MSAKKTDIQADALHAGKSQKGEVGVSKWRECCLEDICAKVLTGGTPSTKKAEYFSNGKIPWLKTKEVNFCRIDETESFITPEGLANSAAKLVPENSVIVAMYGQGDTAGRVAINRIPLATNQACCNLVVDAKVADYRFVFYCLWNSYEELVARKTGSAQPNLNTNLIKTFGISLPPLPEQRAIASVLSNLDDKIDLLNRQNKTLESMAETLFRQWFIEAPPQPSPRPSPSGRGGKKPGVVADLIEFNPQRALRKGTVAPYLEMASLSNTTFAPESWYEREFSSGTKFTNGDTLLARITPCLENGKAAYITFLKDEQVAWGSTEYIVMRPKAGLHPFFAYSLARNSDFKDYAEGCLEGSSGRQRVNVDHLRNYSMSMPDQATVDKFNAIENSIVSKLHLNSCQVRSLTKLRDTLLPKLMSGEAKVEI